ncbi:hypothetical protein [Methylobacter marinus]|uniref:hypothetical protein n=1 Tax=Methylobacter marinus TaxID=34058 RepID=UPI00036C7932|nr:hypothetical protein [Methylobacter marinus]
MTDQITEIFTDELLRLDGLIGESAERFFDGLDRAEIIADLLTEDERIYIDSFEKLSCALAIYHISLAITATVRGAFGEALKHSLAATFQRGVYLERSESQKEVSEQATEAARSRNAENISIKNDALDYYVEHKTEFKSLADAARQIAGKIVIMKYRTVYDWIRDYEKSAPD